MKKVFLSITWVAYLFGLLTFFALRGNEHDWMLEMDPSIGTIEESNNRLVFTSLILLIVLALQLVSLIKAQRVSERILISIASSLAVIAWYFYCFNV